VSKKRVLKCAAHGEEEWRGDIICLDCGAIWLCEDSGNPDRPWRFRLINTAGDYLSRKLGECKCGAELFAKGKKGTGVPICSHCVEAREVFKPPVLH
jgi:hypothetical protein